MVNSCSRGRPDGDHSMALLSRRAAVASAMAPAPAIPTLSLWSSVEDLLMDGLVLATGAKASVLLERKSISRAQAEGDRNDRCIIILSVRLRRPLVGRVGFMEAVREKAIQNGC